ncbi:MAG: hypothetical protein JNM00_00305 [Flavobacteriales bacterium]|nr:hypothetical protein [Flavobacteriales bacterium]
MTEDNHDILDLPDGHRRSEEEDSKWIFLVWLSFAILAAGLVGMFFHFPAWKMLICVGLGLLLFRTLLVFVLKKQKQTYEYLYLVGMFLLVVASVLNLLNIFTSRTLFMVAFILFALGILFVKTRKSGEEEPDDEN